MIQFIVMLIISNSGIMLHDSVFLADMIITVFSEYTKSQYCYSYQWCILVKELYVICDITS